jgi:hypothetical protein
MGNDLIVSAPAGGTWEELVSAMRGLSPQQRREELAAGQWRIVGSIVRMAAAVRVMDENGEAVTTDDYPMLPQLRRIAHGQLTAEAFQRFYKKPYLLNAVAQLPPPEQRRLAEGGTVEMPVVMPDGTIDIINQPAANLTPKQAAQVFERDHIRSVPAQRAILHERLAQEKVRKSEEVGKFKVDYERHTARCGRWEFTQAELEAVVKALKGK